MHLMGSAQWPALLLTMALIVSACSSDVTESEEYLALQQERDEAVDAQAESEGQFESMEQQLADINQQIETTRKADAANQENISMLEAELEDEKSRIEPYPQVFVDEFVVGCAEGDSTSIAPCQCTIEKVQEVMPLGEFVTVSVAFLDTEVDPETGLPLGDISGITGADVFFDVLLDCFLFGVSDSRAQTLAAACEPGETDGDLILYNWTSYTPTGSLAAEFGVTDFIVEFEDRYPDVNVVYTEYDSNEEMLAQVEAGVSYDVVHPSDWMVSVMKGENLLVKLNHGAIPGMANLDPFFADPGYDSANEYSIPYQWGTTGIGFNYDYLDDSEGVSWSVIFEPDENAKHLGRVSFLDDSRETLGAALKYLGYSLNTTNQDELDEASALIKAAKANIVGFDSNNYWNSLTRGDTHVAMGWNGDFLWEFDRVSNDFYDAYEHFGYAIPTEGAAVWVDTMAIPTTAEHPCTAHAFIDMVLEPFIGGELTNWNYYASPNLAAEEHIYPDILEWEAVYPSEETMASLEFFEDLGDFEINYADAFAQAKS